jgi:hypothetical protein
VPSGVKRLDDKKTGQLVLRHPDVRLIIVRNTSADTDIFLAVGYLGLHFNLSFKLVFTTLVLDFTRITGSR